VTPTPTPQEPEQKRCELCGREEAKPFVDREGNVSRFMCATDTVTCMRFSLAQDGVKMLPRLEAVPSNPDRRNR
jgi:hypothetical protein